MRWSCGILFVAEPVGAGEGHDLEGLDAAGGGHVRAAAEVDEVAVAIEARSSSPGSVKLLDEVDLHEVAVALDSPSRPCFARLEFADELLVARDDFGHLCFDGGEVASV